MSDAGRGGTGPGRLSLDQLAALNDEIAALARAGLPLERGLLTVGRDVPGTLGEVMITLGERMSRGEGLAEAMAAEGSRFPRIYRAVVEAGLRAGRLPVALEGLSGFVRGYAEARRSIGMALLYPMIVLAVAYTMFVVMVTEFVPRLLATFESLRVPNRGSLLFLSRLGERATYWGPVLPAVLILMGLVWAWSGRAERFQASRKWSPLRAFPWMRSMLVQFEAANFADLLAMLLEHDVPLPDAVVLASDASGDPALARSGHAIAEAVQRGEPPRLERGDGDGPPPLLRWLLVTGRQQVSLVAALRQVAVMYRKRAMHQAEKLRVFLPTTVLLAVGGSATLLYALTIFVPFTSLLKGLAIPVP